MTQPLVTFVFPDKDGSRTGICHLPWNPNWDVQKYLHAHPLRQLGLIARWHRTYHWNKRGERIRIRYVPAQNDVITFGRPVRPEG